MALYSFMNQYKNCEIIEIEYFNKDLNNIGRDLLLVSGSFEHEVL